MPTVSFDPSEIDVRPPAAAQAAPVEFDPSEIDKPEVRVPRPSPTYPTTDQGRENLHAQGQLAPDEPGYPGKLPPGGLPPGPAKPPLPGELAPDFDPSNPLHHKLVTDLLKPQQGDSTATAVAKGALSVGYGLVTPDSLTTMAAGGMAGRALQEAVNLPRVAAVLSRLPQAPQVLKAVDVLAARAVPTIFAGLNVKGVIQQGQVRRAAEATGDTAAATQATVQEIGNAILALAGAYGSSVAGARVGEAFPTSEAAPTARNPVTGQPIPAEAVGGIATPTAAQAQATATALEQAGRNLAAGAWKDLRLGSDARVYLKGFQGELAQRAAGPATVRTTLVDGKSVTSVIADDGTVIRRGYSRDMSPWLQQWVRPMPQYPELEAAAVPEILTPGGGPTTLETPGIVRAAAASPKPGDTVELSIGDATVRSVAANGDVSFTVKTPTGSTDWTLPLGRFQGLTKAQVSPQPLPAAQVSGVPAAPGTTPAVSPPAPPLPSPENGNKQPEPIAAPVSPAAATAETPTKLPEDLVANWVAALTERNAAPPGKKLAAAKEKEQQAAQEAMQSLVGRELPPPGNDLVLNDESYYAPDEEISGLDQAQSIYQETRQEQLNRQAGIQMAQQALTTPNLPDKVRKRLESSLATDRASYENAFQEVENGFSPAIADRMRAEIEGARPAAPVEKLSAEDQQLKDLAESPDWGVLTADLKPGDILSTKPVSTEGIGWWTNGDWEITSVGVATKGKNKGHMEAWGRPVGQTNANPTLLGLDELEDYRKSPVARPQPGVEPGPTPVEFAPEELDKEAPERPPAETQTYRAKSNDKIDVKVYHDPEGWSVEGDWNLQGQAGGYLAGSGYQQFFPTRDAAMEAFLKNAIRQGHGPQYELDAPNTKAALKARAQKMKDWLEGLRPKAEPEKAQEPAREFSSTQANLTNPVASKLLAYGKTIHAGDLTGDKLETEPHITVKYGLHGDDPEEVKKLLQGQGPITVILGKTSVFPAAETQASRGGAGEADVLKVGVTSPALHALNQKISDALPHTDTHPVYQPHATIAYLKPGKGKHYEGKMIAGVTGHQVTIDRIQFSGKDGKQTEIVLSGKPESQTQPAEPLSPTPAAQPPPQIVQPKEEAKPLTREEKLLANQKRMEEIQRQMAEAKKAKEPEKPEASTPANLHFLASTPADVKHEYTDPKDYYERMRTTLKGDYEYIQGWDARQKAIAGKKGANELRRKDDSETNARRNVYAARYTELELSLGLRAAETLRAEVEGRPAPETKAVPDKAGYHNFFNMLHRGDTVEAPQGPLTITRVEAFNMQPVIPGGPRGQWGAIGPSHRDVTEIEARLANGKTQTFRQHEFQQHLGLAEAQKPKVDPLASKVLFNDSVRLDDIAGAARRAIEHTPENAAVEIKRLQQELSAAQEHLEKLTEAGDSQRQALQKSIADASKVINDWGMSPASRKFGDLQIIPEDANWTKKTGEDSNVASGDRVSWKHHDGKTHEGTFQGIAKNGMAAIDSDDFGKLYWNAKKLRRVSGPLEKAEEPLSTPVAAQPSPQIVQQQENEVELDPDIIAAATEALGQKLKKPERSPASPTSPAATQVSGPKSYRFDVKTGNDWTPGPQRFATEEEAKNAANELMSRWMAVSDTRVAQTDDEPNYRFDKETWKGVRLEAGEKGAVGEKPQVAPPQASAPKETPESQLSEAAKAARDRLKAKYGNKPSFEREQVGVHGPITRRFHHDAAGAIAWLKEQQTGEAVGALYHPAIGDIDLVWGKEGRPWQADDDGYGLAHIIAKHGKEFDVNQLQEILKGMRRIPSRRHDRAEFQSDRLHATVRLSWDHKAKKWLLTAFDWTIAEKQKPRSASETSPAASIPGEREEEAHPSERGPEPSAPTTSIGVREAPEGAGPTPPATEGSTPTIAPKPPEDKPEFERELTNYGLSKEDLKDLATMGAEHMVINKLSTFPEWEARMNADLGEAPDPVRRGQILRLVYQYATATAKNFGITAQPAPPQTTAAPPSKESGLIPEGRALIDSFRRLIHNTAQGGETAQIDTNPALVSFVKEVTGRSPADGSIDTKQIYDILETALNQEIADHGAAMMAPGADVAKYLNNLRTLLQKLPTQAIRSEEQVKFQQFSTPPTEAFVVARVLAPTKDDLVLEPSAGTGSLAAFAKAAGAKVLTNEINPRRAELLRLSGYDVQSVDAEQIDNLYDDVWGDQPDPTAVLMNPPFSAAGARAVANSNDIGYRHVLQALGRLQAGGRLVAILGGGREGWTPGSRLDAPQAKAFWDKVRTLGTIRANIGINGKEYAKYGTTFDNRIVVIDKVPNEQNVAPVQGDFDTLEEAWNALAGIAGDRQPVRATGLDPRLSTGGAGLGEPARPGDVAGVRRPGEGAGAAVRGGPGGGLPSAAGGGPGGGAERPAGGQPELQPERPVAGDREGRGGSATELEARQTDPAPLTQEPTTTDQTVKAGEDVGDYVAYHPPVPAEWGARPHAGIIVETQTMASVAEPPIRLKPNVPPETIASGKLSDVQLGAIAHALQAHENFLADGRRLGYFVGDGTGVGKGRIIAGTALHYWRTLPKGQRKIVWVSFNEGLSNAARDDLDQIGGQDVPVYSLEKVKPTKTLQFKDGILFVPYSKLAMQQAVAKDGTVLAKGATKADKASAQKLLRRLQQIIDWAGGEDAAPVIVFDEVHLAKNAAPKKVEVGEVSAGGKQRTATQKATLRGRATIELQNKLPKGRVLYSSATGFSDVANMAYANRLGIWGEGTPFKDFQDFRSQIEQGGIGVMEVVAQNLKAQGKYLSRFLSYQGVQFDEVTHEITPEQHKLLDKAGDAWRMVMDRFNAAADATVAGTGKEGEGDPNARRKVRSNAMSQLFGSQLRFYRSLYTALKVPRLIQMIDDAASDTDANGQPKEKQAVVISVLETGKAQQDRELDRIAKSGDEDLEGADISPIASLTDMVDKRFPTIQYETVTNAEGQEVTQPAVGPDGQPVQNKEALAAKKALLEEIEKLKGEFPDSAIDQIINRYGPENVAELTKRSERLVRNPETGKRELKSRGSDLDATNLQEMQAFQDGDKYIAIISNAASTGISLHSSVRAKNQRRRLHVMLQLKWSADMTMQDLGRTHRTAQANAPHYILMSLNVDAEKRFAATIARRLEQLGALSRGERKAGGGATDLARYNFESKYGRLAVEQVVDTLYSGRDQFGFLSGDRLKQLYPDLEDGHRVLTLMGLYDQATEDKKTERVAPDVAVNKFFNRLMILPIRTANQVFRAFSDTMDRLIESAKRQGTFDAGAELIKATSLSQDAPALVVHQDPTTGAQAVYYRLRSENPRYRHSWAEVRKAGDSVYRVKASGRLLAVSNSGYRETDPASGEQVTRLGTRGASGTYGNVYDKELADTTEKGRYQRIPADANTEREWNKQYDDAGPVVISHEHLITGSILPIWNKIQEQRGQGKSAYSVPLKIRIGKLDSGHRLIGADVEQHRVQNVLKALGHAPVVTPADVAKGLRGGKQYDLAQGAWLKQVTVSGEKRIELQGAAHFSRLFSQWGLQTEQIASRQRWFVPNDTVLAKVLKELPVRMAGEEEKPEKPEYQRSRQPAAPGAIAAHYHNGTVYVNRAGMDALASVWDEKNLLGMKLESYHVVSAVKALEQKAPGLVAALEEAAAANPRVVVTSYDRPLHDVIAGVRHEWWHAFVSSLDSHLGKYEGVLVDHPLAQKAISTLAQIGYTPREMASEIGAHLAAAQYRELGLTLPEAQELWYLYVGLLDLEHGKNLEQGLKRTAPAMKGALRDYTQRQAGVHPGVERGTVSGESQAGSPGATEGPGSVGRGIPQAGPGEGRPQAEREIGPSSEPLAIRRVQSPPYDANATEAFTEAEGRAEYQPPKGQAEPTLWVNRQAYVTLLNALGETVDPERHAVSFEVGHSRKAAAGLAARIGKTFGKTSGEEAGAQRRALNDLRRLLFRAAALDGKGRPVAIVQSGPEMDRAEIEAAAEEEWDHIRGLHLTGGTTAGLLRSYADLRRLAPREVAKAEEALRAHGYHNQKHYAHEIFVRLLRPGKYRELGLSEEEAGKLARAFAKLLRETHGEPAYEIADDIYRAHGINPADAGRSAPRPSRLAQADRRGRTGRRGPGRGDQSPLSALGQTEPGGVGNVEQAEPGTSSALPETPARGAGEDVSGRAGGPLQQGRDLGGEPLRGTPGTLPEGESAHELPQPAQESQPGSVAPEANENPEEKPPHSGEAGFIHAPMLTGIPDYLAQKFGSDAPKANYSGFQAVRRVFLPGQKLAEVEAASKKVFTAAVRAGGASAQESVILQSAIPAIKKALGGSGVSWEEMHLAYSESRLRGLRQRFEEYRDQASGMDPDELQAAIFNRAGSDASPFLIALSAIEGRQGMAQDLAQTAMALTEREDWDTLRSFLEQSFDDASQRVARLMDPHYFNEIAHAIQTDPKIAEADRIYGDSIEAPMRQNHALNEGFMSDALGPLNRYIPLISFDRKQHGGPGRRLPYRAPKNPANFFATGLSENYDQSMESFAKRLAIGIRANDKAALINTLKSTRWMQKQPANWDGVFHGPDGIDYEGIAEEMSPSRTILTGGKTIHTAAQMGIMPKFLNAGLKPILAREPQDPEAVLKLARWINMLSTRGPWELVFHSAGLMGALYSNTPFLGESGLDKALSAPLVKWFGVRGKLLAVDPTTPENLKKLQEMAEAGAVPSRSGKVTYSKEYAGMTGAKLERFSFAPLLYGPKGIDARARILMYDIFQAAYPDGTAQDLYHFVNQIGNYTPEFQGGIEQALKQIGLGPFATAGMTRLVNASDAYTGAAKAMFGKGPYQNMSPEAKAWMWAAGAIMTLALWVIAYRKLTGQWPLQDKRAKLLQIPVGGGNGYIDQFRYGQLGRARWGDGPETGYLTFGAFDPLSLRGARLIGAPGFFQAHQLGGTFAQQMESAQADVLNALSHPALGPLARSLFVGLAGREPQITGFHDQGRPDLRLMPAIPGKLKPGFLGGFAPALVHEVPSKHPGFAAQQGAKTAAAIRELNSFVGDIGEGSGFLGNDRGQQGAAWLRFVQQVASPLIPPVTNPASNPYTRAKALRTEAHAVGVR